MTKVSHKLLGDKFEHLFANGCGIDSKNSLDCTAPLSQDNKALFSLGTTRVEPSSDPDGMCVGGSNVSNSSHLPTFLHLGLVEGTRAVEGGGVVFFLFLGSSLFNLNQNNHDI